MTQTLGEEIIAWIESTCLVPEGALVGQPIALMPWQQREILRIHDNSAVTRRAIISVGRKSGKTSLAAKMVRMSPVLSDVVVCRDGTKQLHLRPVSGAHDLRRALGRAPSSARRSRPRPPASWRR